MPCALREARFDCWKPALKCIILIHRGVPPLSSGTFLPTSTKAGIWIDRGDPRVNEDPGGWRLPAMMNRHNLRGVRSRRRGTVLLYVMFGMIVFALFASLAVDVGHARVTKVQLQFAP